MKHPKVATASFNGHDNLKISVPKGGDDDSAYDFDMMSEMVFGNFDDFESLERHSRQENWWSARLVDEIFIEGTWKETVYDVYIAHLRTYALYTLRGQGVRRQDCALQDIHDMMVRLYSEYTTKEARDRLTNFAWMGFATEQLGSRPAVHDLNKRDRDAYEQLFMSFYKEAFAYQLPPSDPPPDGWKPVWIEEAFRRRLLVERSKGLIESAAKAFQTRGFLIRQAAENEKARRNQLGMVVMDDLVDRVRKQLQSGPAAGAEDDTDLLIRD